MLTWFRSEKNLIKGFPWPFDAERRRCFLQKLGQSQGPHRRATLAVLKDVKRTPPNPAHLGSFIVSIVWQVGPIIINFLR